MKWSVESRPVPLAAGCVREYDLRKTVFGCHMAGRVIAIKLPVVRLLFSKAVCFARTSQRLLSLSAWAQIK
jgi:hypothetical protein